MWYNQIVKLTIAVKLNPTPEQYDKLIATMEVFNRAVQCVADVAFEQHTANKIELHHQLYYRLRSEYNMSAQMAVRAIGKACEAYKRDKRVHCEFDIHGAMVFDERMMSFKGLTHVSLLTLSGRELIPIRFGTYQAGRMDRVKGQADLVLRDGVFYLYTTVEMPEAPPSDTIGGVLGIDLGICEIATDSEGNSYSGEPVKAIRRSVKRIRGLLQSKGTKSAKKHLKKIANKQSRYVRDTNHCISKRIVNTASESAKALALEDLKGIRDRSNGFGREMRWLMGNWSFNQLAGYIHYKAALAGIPVITVDPRNTSRTCSVCGYIDKANRKSQSKFLCLECGTELNADYNAALNISVRAALSTGLLSQASA
jgi:putative transposase